MDVKQAKILISASEGRIEFEGSEEFVERQVTAFGDLIKDSLRSSFLIATKKATRVSEHIAHGEVRHVAAAGCREDSW